MRKKSAKFDIVIPPQDITCEAGLQQKLAAGDRDAFAWVYKNYCKRIFGYACLLTKDEVQSEDIVQEVFIRLWTYRDKIYRVKDFNAYLYRLYRNFTLDVLDQKRKEVYGKQSYAKVAETITNGTTDKLNYQEKFTQVLSAIDALPPQRRQIFLLSKDHNLKRTEVAGMLNISPFTVKASLQQSLQQLRLKIGSVN